MQQLQSIIEPVLPELIERELTDDTFVRYTNKAGNVVHIIRADSAPNTMREIARLRELSFRLGGGGSGKEMDIDRFDTMDFPYGQLIVWNPDAREIVGGYRYRYGRNAIIGTDGQPDMALGHIFVQSRRFIEEYLPYTLEMGRAFVQPKYQSAHGGIKSLFALDNLWDGIGALVANIPDLKYLVGKVTIYSTTEEKARKAMIYYFEHYFADRENLLIPRKREILSDDDVMMFSELITGEDYKSDFAKLNRFVRSRGECIPPLLHAYLDLSPTLKTFGTVFDPDFGDIYDTGVMITLDDVYQVKKDRYISTYLKNNHSNTCRNFV